MYNLCSTLREAPSVQSYSLFPLGLWLSVPSLDCDHWQIFFEVLGALPTNWLLSTNTSPSHKTQPCCCFSQVSLVLPSAMTSVAEFICYYHLCVCACPWETNRPFLHLDSTCTSMMEALIGWPGHRKHKPSAQHASLPLVPLGRRADWKTTDECGLPKGLP